MLRGGIDRRQLPLRQSKATKARRSSIRRRRKWSLAFIDRMKADGRRTLVDETVWLLSVDQRLRNGANRLEGIVDRAVENRAGLLVTQHYL